VEIRGGYDVGYWAFGSRLGEGRWKGWGYVGRELDYLREDEQVGGEGEMRLGQAWRATTLCGGSGRRRVSYNLLQRSTLGAISAPWTADHLI
jgi:hypothetical protein